MEYGPRLGWRLWNANLSEKWGHTLWSTVYRAEWIPREEMSCHQPELPEPSELKNESYAVTFPTSSSTTWTATPMLVSGQQPGLTLWYSYTLSPLSVSTTASVTWSSMGVMGPTPTPVMVSQGATYARLPQVLPCRAKVDSHPSLDSMCSCGVYSFHKLSTLLDQAPHFTPNSVVGRVALRGKYVSGELGSRFEYAYPYDLHVVGEGFVSDEIAKDLARAYQVDASTVTRERLMEMTKEDVGEHRN